MSEQIFRDVMRAAATGDSAEADRLDDRIPDADRPAYHRYITALFGILLGERFERDQSHEAVMRFVEQLKSGYRSLQPPMKPLAVEATIRGMLGEDSLFDEIDPHDQIVAMLLVIRAIVAQDERIRGRLDDYLTDAETLAREL